MPSSKCLIGARCHYGHDGDTVATEIIYRVSDTTDGSWTSFKGDISDIKDEILAAHEIAVHLNQGRIDAIDVRRAMRLFNNLFDKHVG